MEGTTPPIRSEAADRLGSRGVLGLGEGAP